MPDKEAELIRRVLAGDKNAFEPLVAENQKNVYNLALKMLRNPADALDITQEAFLKAYTHLPSFRGESRFSVWLYRLTYNLCVDYSRRPAGKTVSVTLSGDREEDEELDIPDTRHLPEDELERRELRRTVDRAISALPENYRQILLLREYSGLSYEELGQELHLSPGTVKSRLARARLAAAGLLTEDGTFQEPPRQKGRKEGNRHGQL